MNGFKATFKISKPDVSDALEALGDESDPFGILDIGTEIQVHEGCSFFTSHTLNMVINSIIEASDRADQEIGIDMITFSTCPLTPMDIDPHINVYLAVLFAQRYLCNNTERRAVTFGDIHKALGSYRRVVENDKFDDCPICIRGYDLHQGYRKLSCGHMFHKSCVDHWFITKEAISCPICRDTTEFVA